MSVSLKWITPNTDATIGHIARVSNLDADEDTPSGKLIQYLIKHKHWSPFEMASACVEIVTTRDIARQILRHRSFHFQEFSQRYSKVLPEPIFREARMQDTKNRQNSLVTDDHKVHGKWSFLQGEAWDVCYRMYIGALSMGIAKEVARALLPEGLVQTRLYMCGTIRDWIHYLQVRTSQETQFEHRQVANEILQVLYKECPITIEEAVMGQIND